MCHNQPYFIQCRIESQTGMPRTQSLTLGTALPEFANLRPRAFSSSRFLTQFLIFNSALTFLLFYKMVSLTEHVSNIYENINTTHSNREKMIEWFKTEFSHSEHPSEEHFRENPQVSESIDEQQKLPEVDYSNFAKCSNILHYGHWEAPEESQTKHHFHHELAGNKSMIWKLDDDKAECDLHYYTWVEAFQCMDTVNKLQKPNTLAQMNLSEDILVRMVGDSRMRQYFVTLLALLEGKDKVYDAADTFVSKDSTTAKKIKPGKSDYIEGSSRLRTLIDTAFNAKLVYNDARVIGKEGATLNAIVKKDQPTLRSNLGFFVIFPVSPFGPGEFFLEMSIF